MKTFLNSVARFFPLLRRFYAIDLNFDWFVALFVSVVIGQSYYYGFGFTRLNTLLQNGGNRF